MVYPKLKQSTKIEELMKRYRHLIQDQRYQIWSLKKTGMIEEKIAKELGTDDPSTISRELKRNKGKRGYRPVRFSYGII
ncbi:MAG: helix-turn-helix domain-containing protein [Thermodesulfovibrionia bacterium]|nr:helix-turn-helix domain-containing protein [Thermodesulfovibrionia bacterium]